MLSACCYIDIDLNVFDCFWSDGDVMYFLTLDGQHTFFDHGSILFVIHLSSIVFQMESWSRLLRRLRRGIGITVFRPASLQHRMIVSSAGRHVMWCFVWLRGCFVWSKAKGFRHEHATLKPAITSLLDWPLTAPQPRPKIPAAQCGSWRAHWCLGGSARPLGRSVPWPTRSKGLVWGAQRGRLRRSKHEQQPHGIAWPQLYGSRQWGLLAQSSFYAGASGVSQPCILCLTQGGTKQRENPDRII